MQITYQAVAYSMSRWQLYSKQEKIAHTKPFYLLEVKRFIPATLNVLVKVGDRRYNL